MNIWDIVFDTLLSVMPPLPVLSLFSKKKIIPVLQAHVKFL